MVCVTNLILRFSIVQNKFQQTNITKINHINDNHMKFEVSLHFGGDLAYCAPPRFSYDLSHFSLNSQLRSTFSAIRHARWALKGQLISKCHFGVFNFTQKTSQPEVKFMYSEKATKFCEITTLLLSYKVPVKSKVEILQNFVAFSEYMNFILLT